MPSIPDTVHDLAVAKVTALALEYAGEALAVLKRKLPAVSEDIDPAPGLFVTPSEMPGRDDPFDTEGARLREHVYQIVLALPGNRDNASGLPDLGAYREDIIDAFRDPLPVSGLDEFLRLEVTPGPAVDREMYSKLYDYTSVCGLRFVTVE